jgi:hypothetical protein
MGLTRRISPEFAPGESSLVGLDVSPRLPPGAVVASAALAIFSNVANPAPSSDFTVGEVLLEGNIVYARLSGGVAGNDSQLRWTITDTDGNTFMITVLMLCALTS